MQIIARERFAKRFGRHLKIAEIIFSIGVIPGGGATVRLPHRIGVAKSIELILTGRVLSGTEALSINLIDSFTGSIQPSKWSREFAEQITRSNHNQIHSVKQLLRASFEDRSVLLTKERSLLVQILRNKAN